MDIKFSVKVNTILDNKNPHQRLGQWLVDYLELDRYRKDPTVHSKDELTMWIDSLYQKDGAAAFKHIQQKIDWTMDSSVLYSIIED